MKQKFILLGDEKVIDGKVYLEVLGEADTLKKGYSLSIKNIMGDLYELIEVGDLEINKPICQ